MGICAIFIYICEQVQHVPCLMEIAFSGDEREPFVSVLCKGWHVAAVLQEKPRRNGDRTVSQRIPISSLSPKGDIWFSSLLLAINLPPLPISHQPAFPVPRYQRTGLPVCSHCLTLMCGCSHMRTWHSPWEMTAKVGKEATSQTGWENRRH